MMMRSDIATGQRRGKGTKRRRRFLPLMFLYSFVLLFLCAEKIRPVAASQEKVSIRWTPDQSSPGKVAVEVFGLSADAIKRLRQAKRTLAQWQSLLAVYAGPAETIGASKLPPMLGVYRVESNSLRFEPQFDLEPGLTYCAVIRPDQLPGGIKSAPPVTSVFQSPRRSLNPTTLVSQVYPSADTLPENLLKFYIHFTAPMSRGNVYDHIHL